MAKRFTLATLISVAIFAVSGIVSIGVVAPEAGAQTVAAGYPPPPPPPPPVVPPVVPIVVPVGPGTTGTTLTDCLFKPNTTVTVSVDGRVYTTVTVSNIGCVVLNLSLYDPNACVPGNTSAELSINGLPPVTVAVSDPTITASGTGANGVGRIVTWNVTYQQVCSAASSSSTLAFTGADIGAMVAGGAVLLLLGAGLILVSRRRATAQASSK